MKIVKSSTCWQSFRNLDSIENKFNGSMKIAGDRSYYDELKRKAEEVNRELERANA